MYVKGVCECLERARREEIGHGQLFHDRTGCRLRRTGYVGSSLAGKRGSEGVWAVQREASGTRMLFRVSWCMGVLG